MRESSGQQTTGSFISVWSARIFRPLDHRPSLLNVPDDPGHGNNGAVVVKTRWMQLTTETPGSVQDFRGVLFLLSHKIRVRFAWSEGRTLMKVLPGLTLIWLPEAS